MDIRVQITEWLWKTYYQTDPTEPYADFKIFSEVNPKFASMWRGEASEFIQDVLGLTDAQLTALEKGEGHLGVIAEDQTVPNASAWWDRDQGRFTGVSYGDAQQDMLKANFKRVIEEEKHD